jgi:phosphoglycerate dehydrogenase-like enzyme
MRLERIVAMDVSDDDLTPEGWRALDALAHEVVRVQRAGPPLPDVLARADALLVGLGVAVSGAMLEAAPRLRYVGVLGTSLASIDTAVNARGVIVRTVPGYATESVAELAIGIVLDVLRDLANARSRAASGDLSEARVLGRELRGLPVGVLGLGAIGRRVVAILRDGFAADVRAWSRTARPELDGVEDTLEAVLSRSDVVIICLALTSETRGLLDDARLAHVRDGATIVHLCPAEILRVEAVLPRLRAGTLRLVTDHGDELAPTDLAALRASGACTLYPPIGYATREAMAARQARAIAELARFLDDA